jgi:hypothetical protein
LWQGLEKFKAAGDDEQRPWGLIAEKHLRGLVEAENVEHTLADTVDVARRPGRNFNPAGPSERLAGTALRAEAFGDASLALACWKKLKLSAGTGTRAWDLLAARKCTELTSKAWPAADEKKKRVELVRARLDEAANAQGSEPDKTRVLCQDIVALYEKSSETELVEPVRHARKLLQDFPSDR